MLSEMPDECETAAEVYQCGRDLAPTITNNIFTQSLGNATEVLNYTHINTIQI